MSMTEFNPDNIETLEEAKAAIRELLDQDIAALRIALVNQLKATERREIFIRQIFSEINMTSEDMISNQDTLLLDEMVEKLVTRFKNIDN